MNIQSPPQRLRELRRKIWCERYLFRPFRVFAYIASALLMFITGLFAAEHAAALYDLAERTTNVLSFFSAMLLAVLSLTHGVWDKWSARSRCREQWANFESAVLLGMKTPQAFAEWRNSPEANVA